MGEVMGVKSLVASGHVSDGPGLGPEMQLAPCLRLSGAACYLFARLVSWITEQSKNQNHSSPLHPSSSH